MKVINIQIQHKRVPNFNVKKALDLLATFAQESQHIRDMKVDSNPRRTYININYLSIDWRKTWSEIKKKVLGNKNVGPFLKAGSIIICEGRHSWDDYLLLHHFDEKKSKADKIYEQCAVAYKHLKKNEYKKAVPFLLKASKSGDPWAQYNLGLCYEKGRGGLPQDIRKAFDWCSRAAKRGYKLAQRKISCGCSKSR